jgi:hypothetical protein
MDLRGATVMRGKFVEKILGLSVTRSQAVSLYLSFRLLDPHFEFDVNNVVPVPAKQVLHQNERLVEEIRQKNQSEVLIHLLNCFSHVSFLGGAVHIESENKKRLKSG